MNEQMQPSGGNSQNNHPAKGLATASLVMGILACTLDGIIFGVLGIVFSTMAKKRGFTGAIATAGFVMSIVGVGLGIIILAFCGPILCTLLGI